VEIHHAGINYIDTYHRTGLYPNALPLTLGREGAGRIVRVGREVSNVAVDDLVVFFAQGCYAEYVAVDAASVFKLPTGIDTRTAAAAYLQGLTAHYLTCSTYPIKKDDIVLIHAAAGGTGSLIVQMAKLKGGKVIGTVGNDKKAELAKEAGADHIINYSNQDFEKEVKRITADQGVNCVYDGVGLATYEKSLKCLRKRGYLVLFGNASGPVPPISPLELTKAGSVFLTRPTLNDYIAGEALVTRSQELFNWLSKDQLHLTIAAEFPLSEAGKAHQLLEGRGIAGKILINVKQG